MRQSHGPFWAWETVKLNGRVQSVGGSVFMEQGAVNERSDISFGNLKVVRLWTSEEQAKLDAISN